MADAVNFVWGGLKMADKQFWKGVIAGVGFSVLMGASGYAGYLAAHSPSILDDPNVSGKFQLLEQMIDQYYYEEPDPELLADGGPLFPLLYIPGV